MGDATDLDRWAIIDAAEMPQEPATSSATPAMKAGLLRTTPSLSAGSLMTRRPPSGSPTSTATASPPSRGGLGHATAGAAGTSR